MEWVPFLTRLGYSCRTSGGTSAADPREWCVFRFPSERGGHPAAGDRWTLRPIWVVCVCCSGLVQRKLGDRSRAEACGHAGLSRATHARTERARGCVPDCAATVDLWPEDTGVTGRPLNVQMTPMINSHQPHRKHCGTASPTRVRAEAKPRPHLSDPPPLYMPLNQ